MEEEKIPQAETRSMSRMTGSRPTSRMQEIQPKESSDINCVLEPVILQQMYKIGILKERMEVARHCLEALKNNRYFIKGSAEREKILRIIQNISNKLSGQISHQAGQSTPECGENDEDELVLMHLLKLGEVDDTSSAKMKKSIRPLHEEDTETAWTVPYERVVLVGGDTSKLKVNPKRNQSPKHLLPCARSFHHSQEVTSAP